VQTPDVTQTETQQTLFPAIPMTMTKLTSLSVVTEQQKPQTTNNVTMETMTSQTPAPTAHKEPAKLQHAEMESSGTQTEEQNNVMMVY